MVSLSDLANGPKVFEENFGPKWGPRWWRMFFALSILAAATLFLEEIVGGLNEFYSHISGLWPTHEVKVEKLPTSDHPPAQSTPQLSPLPPAPVPVHESYTDKPVSWFVDAFKGRTELQANLLIAPEIGKWINADGALQFISPLGMMRLYGDSYAIQCQFDHALLVRLTAFRIGDTVKIVGKISLDQSAAFLQLEDCELR
jgi:hypothetical protein